MWLFFYAYHTYTILLLSPSFSLVLAMLALSPLVSLSPFLPFLSSHSLSLSLSLSLSPAALELLLHTHTLTETFPLFHPNIHSHCRRKTLFFFYFKPNEERPFVLVYRHPITALFHNTVLYMMSVHESMEYLFQVLFYLTSLSLLFPCLPSGLDHRSWGLRRVLLWRRVRLSSQLLHERHQPCHRADTGESQPCAISPTASRGPCHG